MDVRIQPHTSLLVYVLAKAEKFLTISARILITMYPPNPLIGLLHLWAPLDAVTGGGIVTGQWLTSGNLGTMFRFTLR